MSQFQTCHILSLFLPNHCPKNFKTEKREKKSKSKIYASVALQGENFQGKKKNNFFKDYILLLN